MNNQIEIGKIYRNKNGADYICISKDKTDTPVMQHLESKWTFKAVGINFYADGTIDWNRSKDGFFAKKEFDINSNRKKRLEKIIQNLDEILCELIEAQNELNQQNDE